MIFNRSTIPNFLAALYRAFSVWAHGVDPVITTDVVREIRSARCAACTFNVCRQCVKCTCVVDLKVMMATEKCPDNRWGPQTARKTGL